MKFIAGSHVHVGSLKKAPLSAGFAVIAIGYSTRFPEDLENLERQFEVYDALNFWCRLDVAKGEA